MQIQKKINLELILVADADTAVLCSLEGACKAEKKYFGHDFHCVADTEIET